MKDITIRVPRPTQSYVSPEDDPLWDALTSSRISMPLHKLLQLMPRFKDTLASLTSDTKYTSLLVNLAEPGAGPPSGNHQQGTRPSWLHHRRRFRCQRNQRSHMPRSRSHPVGTMPFLAPDGRYSIGSPNKVNPSPRLHARRPYVHHIGNSLAHQSPGSIPNACWLSLVANNQH